MLLLSLSFLFFMRFVFIFFKVLFEVIGSCMCFENEKGKSVELGF